MLSVVGRRYLVGEPRPLTVHDAAVELAALVSEQDWTARKVSHTVSVVQSSQHNLLIELLRTGTLTLVDLEALEQRPA